MPSYGYKKGTFSNMVEFEKGMNSILKEVQEATLKRMRTKLEEFITEEVYSKSVSENTAFNAEDSYNDDEYVEYERTYNLYDIWNTERVYVSHGKIYGSIEPTNYGALEHSSFDSKIHQHVGYGKSGWSLTTKDYVHIINDGLKYSNSIFGRTPPRPFWDKFMEWANKNYNIIFKEECIKRGLNIA